MRKTILALVLGLGACAAPASNRPYAPPAATYAPPPAPYAPPTASYAAPRQDYAPATPEHHDRCGADQLQWLVGRSRTEIPIPLEPGRRRVLCATCPMTRENNEFRQTILYDAASGKVTSVACD